MGIIADLEDSPRGVYCGAVGYLAPATAGPPRASFNVAIRTVVVDAETRHRRVRRGRRHHVGLSAGRRVRRDRGEGAGPHRAASAVRAARDDAARPRRADAAAGQHVERLRGSAAYFGFAFDEAAVARRWTRRGARHRPRRSSPPAPSTGSARSRCRAAALDRGAPEPVRLALDDVPVDPADVFLFHKTTARGRYEDARARHPDADDALLINTAGRSPRRRSRTSPRKLDGRWWTPPLDAGLLPGTERAALARGRHVDRATDHVDELGPRRSSRVFSSVRGWRRAVLVGAKVGAPAGVSTGNVNGRMRSSSRGHAQSGQRGGSS